ncbi:LysR family transcriptional regulator [Enterococcus durans IPLA 655]|uniref:LysR family transcriptional regulator n=1 Tax=Enterococcus durans TaxID=53345 RepID=UPI0003285BF7|nr:LysR family transcriptional regulator [Enterococcus durans]EMS74306.1 LysR family transcriptional regulator [Enterococcus durans IPLA 655]
MNLAWLESFFIIAEEKNITQAAEKLHISQPALSKQLKHLESMFQTSLVIRSSKGIQLTKAGQLLYEQGKNLMTQFYSMNKDIQQLTEPKRLTIGCLPSIATSYLPTSDFSNHCIFIQNNSNYLVKSLFRGQIDLAIIDEAFSTENLKSRTLFKENYVILAPRIYELNNKKILTMEEIQNYPIILHQTPCDSSSRILSFAQEKQYSLNIVREVPFGEFIYGYILAEEGLTIVPELIAKNLTHLELDQIPLTELTRTVSVVSQSESNLALLFS